MEISSLLVQTNLTVFIFFFFLYQNMFYFIKISLIVNDIFKQWISIMMYYTRISFSKSLLKVTGFALQSGGAVGRRACGGHFEFLEVDFA